MPTSGNLNKRATFQITWMFKDAGITLTAEISDRPEVKETVMLKIKYLRAAKPNNPVKQQNECNFFCGIILRSHREGKNGYPSDLAIQLSFKLH